MPRVSIALLLALALLASATPLAAAQGAGPRDNPGQERANQGNENAGTDNAAPRDDGPARGPPEGRGPPEQAGPAIGTFQVSAAERRVQGDYVSFRYNESGITDFAAGGHPIFDLSVDPEGAEDRGKGTIARGSQIRVEMPAFRLRAHDNPTAVTQFESDGPLTLHLTQGALIQALDDKRVRFQLGHLSGVIRADNVIVSEDDSLRTEGNLLVLLDEPRGGFDRNRERITEAISNRAIGAEMSIAQIGQELAEDSVSYGNVTITRLNAERGNLTVLIDGEGQDGRVIVLNVDGELLGAQNTEDLDIRFNNITIPRADDLNDILDPDNDGLQPEYYPIYDPITGTFQLIVSIPHYSVHTLTIGTHIVPIQPSIIVGLLAGVFLLVPSALLLFRRK